MDEWVDILDEDGSKTGDAALKSEAHRLGLWHRCFHCWVVWTDDSGGAHLLAQRRAFGKDTWPGYLDVSVAGHLGSGEAPLDGRREMEEEIGVRVAPERLVPLGVRRVEHEISQGFDREFHDVFILLDDTSPSDMPLQIEEVDALIAIPLGGAARMADGETVSALEYKDGKELPIEASLADFVLGSGGYIRDITGAAKSLVAGDSVAKIFDDMVE